ncbi:MAG: hypothetical protein PHN51_10235 [Candidatus Nanopelagicales bacterium]|nr:hypothetical protein [Candidatus Nanopelagicales bacterium]
MSNIALPQSVQERMTEEVFKVFMELFPKDKLGEQIAETIDKYFTWKGFSDKQAVGLTGFEAMVFQALEGFIKPMILKILSEKNQEFQSQLNEAFLKETVQQVNQGVDNITTSLAMAVSRNMVSQVIEQAHKSAISSVITAVDQSGGYHDRYGALLSSLNTAYGAAFPYVHPKTDT